MLQVSLIKENKDLVVKALLKKRFANADKVIDKVIELDDQRKSAQTSMDGTLAESNMLAKEIGKLMKEGKAAEAEDIKKQTASLKAKSKTFAEDLAKYEHELTQLLYTVPNLPHESVPEGKSAEDNIIVTEHGNLPELPESALAHWDLIKKYDIIDFDLGVKITGAGFPVYKGKGARLQRALVNFFLDEAVKAGYDEVQPPVMVNQESGLATGQLPDKEGQMYHIPELDYYMIPTAEVPITNMYRGVIVSEAELPIKNVGFTPCFRKEAGSWGAHVRGLNRLHQFDKVEIVQIRKPEESYKALEEMCLHVQGLLEKLELPYRVLKLCGGDMGFTSALTYDMEVYSGAQKRWLEVSSVSNFETYQSNRLMLRYKGDDKKTKLLHTLNGSALALPRIVASILENNQTAEGIHIPKVLHHYTGFEKITT